MTSAEAITMLDAQLSEHGQDVSLLRMTAGAVAQTVPARASVKEGATEELVNGIMQQIALVIVSPTTAATFVSGAEAGLDQRIPIKGNRVVIAGRARAVQSAFGRQIDGVVSRIEIKVLG